MVEILLFSARWCAPCKIVKQYLRERGIDFKEVDVEKNGELAKKYFVQSLPTIVVLENEVPIASIVGSDLSRLESVLREIHGC
ncbi:thioredoxin family protein [Archaeoglobus sp. JdFR-39]|uniref:thioredoxin family protein n=1 Tax=Archaeoglobus sp. JdFR-39 TaxID=1934996 RepID=UPI0025C37620|nr:thioredoxin family protein [Archaeoglobus sp. JdFR-39]